MTTDQVKRESSLTAPSVAGDDLQGQLQQIQQKLDELHQELARRNRRWDDLEELQDDLTRVLNDMVRSAVTDLDEWAVDVEAEDFATLLKNLLRNTGRISASLAALESAAEFLQDAGPIGNDLFQQLVWRLDQLERQGHLQLGRDLGKAGETLANSLIDHRVVPALQQALREVTEADPNQLQPASLWRLYRATRRPEVRRLMGIALAFVEAFSQAVAAQAAEPDRSS